MLVPLRIAAEPRIIPTADRQEDLRIALRLTYLTLAWMTIEGASSVGLGVVSKSLLLVAFGIDSGIELFSASLLLWRLRTEADGKADAAKVEMVERRASKWAGYALYALALYVVATSLYGLFAHHTADTHESVWGVAIGVVAAIGMPILAKLKLKVAAPDRLNSRALRADAMEAFTCGYMSWVLIAGLVVTRLLGWWWLDSIAALALIPLLIKEAREAVRGECSCCAESSEDVDAPNTHIANSYFLGDDSGSESPLGECIRLKGGERSQLVSIRPETVLEPDP